MMKPLAHRSRHSGIQRLSTDLFVGLVVVVDLLAVAVFVALVARPATPPNPVAIVAAVIVVWLVASVGTAVARRHVEARRQSARPPAPLAAWWTMAGTTWVIRLLGAAGALLFVLLLVAGLISVPSAAYLTAILAALVVFLAAVSRTSRKQRRLGIVAIVVFWVATLLTLVGAAAASVQVGVVIAASIATVTVVVGLYRGHRVQSSDRPQTDR